MFCFRGELGFLDCVNIYMCVVNKLFELLEFIFNFVYVDVKYNEISLNFTAGCLCLSGDVVVLGLSMSFFVPYVSAMGAVTVMRVLLFVLYVCMLRGWEDDGNAGGVLLC